MSIHPAVVVEVRPAGSRALTLRLQIRDGAFSYRPGQYVKVDPYQFAALEGRLRESEARRGKREWPAYFSLSSDPAEDGTFEITPRLPRDGRGAMVATHLVGAAAPGLAITVEGPGGRYGLPEAPPSGIGAFLHVCAGSGVAPNRGMIRHALRQGWPQRHLLVLQERGEEDVLFRSDWEEAAARYGPRFRFRPVYSAGGGEYVSEALLRRETEGLLDLRSTLAFVCGPNDPRGGRPGFCELASASLRALGVAAERIVREGG